MNTGTDRILSITVVLALTMFIGLPRALSQEDMRSLAPEQLKPQSRPAAVFVHDRHNEKANIEDCAVCHHGKGKDGKQDREDMSAGTPCAECHSVKVSTGTPLKRAYHQQCINCHKEQNRGPTYCGGCHKG